MEVIEVVVAAGFGVVGLLNSWQIFFLSGLNRRIEHLEQMHMDGVKKNG